MNKDEVRRIKYMTAQALAKTTPMMQRWVSYGKSPCPVCEFLDSLSWVKFGSLPDFREAHSVLGGPRWAPDSSCECTIDYQPGTNVNAESFAEVEQLWFTTYNNLNKQIFTCNCHGK